MRQAVMTEPGKIELKEADPPEIKDNEILLRVKCIGICGSDIHVNHGTHPFTGYPVIQGHEFSAEVEKVGAGIKGIEPGKKATARPQIVCGKCRPCRRGDYNICDNLKVQGFQAPGTAQDLFVTTEEMIVLLPDSFSFEQGALVEPAAVASHAVSRAGSLADKNIVVLGAGPIGNLVAQFARCRGTKNILVTDLSEFRLGIANKCCIDEISNAGKESLKDASKRVFGEQGFDVAFEAVGVKETIRDAVKTIEKGGKIVVIGVFSEQVETNMSIIGNNELQLIGTLMYKHEDYKKAVDLIGTGDIITEPLVSKHFPLEQYQDAYKYIDEQRDKTMKVMIDL